MNITLAEIICGAVIASMVIGVPVAVLLWDRRTGGYVSAAAWDESDGSDEPSATQREPKA